MPEKPVILMILDGWGIAPPGPYNAAYMAHTPHLDSYFASYAHTELAASGTAVGLPAGQMGNSEVGHLNIGSGRIIYQELTRISKAISDGDFFTNPVLLEVMRHTVAEGTALHLMGLLSDGGVHSHISHLLALLQLARQQQVPRVYLHAFLDGRDVGPKTALTYIAQLEAAMRELGVGSIATVAGRYYAMDRDKRWERIRQAYAALVLGQGERYATAAEGIASAYGRGITDEFVPPFIVAGSDGRIAAGDGVVFFNFRPDRARQLTRALSEAEFTEFARPAGALPVHFACMTQYDATLAAPVAFPQERYEDTLGQVLAARGLQQLRIAETEKYAHVTFFFNGGVETPNKGETRLLIPSPKVATYDLQPAMSACEVTAALLQELEHNKFDVVILNFANPDMVGHTGVMAAAVQAMETVDACVGRIVERILSMGGCACITADHGNLEKMLDESTGQPHTAHTTNKVPFILVGKGAYRLHGGILADIAPTLLELLGIPKPASMTGSSLLEK